MILPALLILASFAAPGVRTGPTVSASAGVEFQQNIGDALPLGGRFLDDQGRRVRLADCLKGGRPAVLIFGYSRCPQLCSLIADAAVQALKGISAVAGADYRILYVSIDPTETPSILASMKRRDFRHYARPADPNGWHYLASDEATVRRLATAAGFYYRYDAALKLYAHPSGIIILTPDGRVSRYFLGIEFSASDIASALERAGKGGTGDSALEILILCARGLGVSGRYGPLIWDILEVFVGLTVAAVFGGIGWMLWNERRQAGGRGAPP